MATVEVKNVFKSKTIWANVLMGVGTLVAAPDLIPTEFLHYVPLVQGIVNVFLRWITTEPVSISGS